MYIELMILWLCCWGGDTVVEEVKIIWVKGLLSDLKLSMKIIPEKRAFLATEFHRSVSQDQNPL